MISYIFIVTLRREEVLVLCFSFPLTVADFNPQDKKASSGSDWYNLPQTVLTPELKRDLQLLRMRSVLDPKRKSRRILFLGTI